MKRDALPWTPTTTTGLMRFSESGGSNAHALSFSDKGAFCFEGQCSSTHSRDTHEFPNFFLGVGPGGSGSTNLVIELNAHPSVFVGDAHLNSQKCCDSELYVLNNQSRAFEGQRAYAAFFSQDAMAKRRTHWFGEKTPLHSAHRLVPFRARAIFGPWLKLFITWREPAEIFISRYFGHVRNQKIRNMTFTKWTNYRLNGFRRVTKCRHDILLTFELTERMIYDPSFPLPATAAMEEHLVRLCGPLANGAYAALEGLGMFRRWAHVFDHQQILCVLLEDQSARMVWVRDRMAQHLNIDRHGFKNSSRKQKGVSSFDRLETHQRETYGEQAVKQMWGTIAEIQNIPRSSSFTEDQRLFSELCSQ